MKRGVRMKTLPMTLKVNKTKEGNLDNRKIQIKVKNMRPSIKSLKYKRPRTTPSHLPMTLICMNNLNTNSSLNNRPRNQSQL